VQVSISIALKLCPYLLPFLRYSASNNGMTLKSGLKVTQSHWKRYLSKACVRFRIRFL